MVSLAVFVLLALFHVLIAQPARPSLFSTPFAFENLNSQPPYEYGPSIITENGVFYQFYCSPGSGDPNGAWDYIRMTTSTDGQNWTPPVVALSPQTPYETNSVCDPSVIKFHGVYFLYHTCINSNANPPDGYTNNRICLAVADSITGPYHPHPTPIIQDLNCPKDPNTAYCVGQPSAVAVNDTVYLFYTNQYPGDGGPNGGLVLLSVSQDGVNFKPANGRQNPSYPQRCVDVKYDLRHNQFIMVQGDVGGPNITWSVSEDGLHFAKYDTDFRINTNPNLPSGGTNNNPGIAGLPDGTMGDGMTWIGYGSSYTTGWGDWHMFRSQMISHVEDSACNECTQNTCDWACQQGSRSMMGYCGYPYSHDGERCCVCVPWVLFNFKIQLENST
eukprot:TRINITY_DN3686_c0_g1_i1.p1 TRINITY_DN3686_c0_g1~~TRINITY_DN3686_c0_g1_i1.p1  ORF type:complete len:387 (-),score=86.86 TRINITY_DN3686_c0_g1_i1:163-1323(-)